MLRTVFKDEQRGGYTSDAGRESTLEFHVMKVSGKDYVHFRIGRKIAERAGLRVKDKIVFAFDSTEKTLAGEICPNAKGWGLQAVGNTENPPLWVRITYQDSWPYRKNVGKCTDVIAKNNKLSFNFPDGTVFGKPKEEEVEDALSDLYMEHKAAVERMEGKKVEGKKRKSKAEIQSFRRKSDGAHAMKEGKPYGRRHDDY